MNSYISELNDYLELYGVLLENNFYSKEKQEDAKELKELIDRLKEPSGYIDFDFPLLKRKISKIFHPDVYTSFNTQSLGIDNVQLLSKVNGVIDDVIQEKKNGNSFAYNEQDPYTDSYEDEEEDFTKNDYFARDQKFPPKPKTEEQLRKERINETINDIKNEVIRTKDYVCMVARDRFNAVFKGIPSTVADYIRIKKRYEDTLMNLTYRDTVITSTLDFLYQAKRVLNDTFTKEVSPLALTYYYNNELSNSQRRMDMTEASLNVAKVRYYQVFDKYAPEYKELIGRWAKGTSEISADIVNINSAINFEVSRNSKDAVIEQLLRKRKRLNKEQEEYPKYEEAKEKIKEFMLKEHPDLAEVYSSYKKEKEKNTKAKEEYLYISQNSKAVKADRLKHVTDEYKKKAEQYDFKIVRLEDEKKRRTSSIFRVRRKYNDFLDRYQNKFENRLEYADMNEISVRR